MTPFPVAALRARFPSLSTGDAFVFFDNAAGAQVPQPVFEAIHDHLLNRNVQRGGRYRRSQEMDAALERSRAAVAAFVNASRPEEVAFGLNATSFIRNTSLAIGQTLAERPEIIVTELDHEANIATWLALERMGARIRWWHARADARLDPTDLDELLSERTRLVACPLASNATGSTVAVAEIARRTHAVGAELFVDAVHYAPHGPIDVQAFDCDYLVCSGYKIFGPHMGFLWGRYASLVALPTFREAFIPDVPPQKLEAGTYVYENVVGMDAALSYLAGLGRELTDRPDLDLRAALVAAMEGIRDYEQLLSRALLALPDRVPGLTVHGLADATRVEVRTPTLLFTVDGVPPAAVTDHLARENIGVRDGHMYAPRLLERLGLSIETGAVRASLVHYNTVEEIEQMAVALEGLDRSAIRGRGLGIGNRGSGIGDQR